MLNGRLGSGGLDEDYKTCCACSGRYEEAGVQALALTTMTDLLLLLNTVSICECFRSSKVFAEVSPLQHFWEQLW